MKRIFKTATLPLLFFLIIISTNLMADNAANLSKNQTEQVTTNSSQSQENKSKESKGVDWFEIVILIGYLGGVFVLLPIVIYTNKNEKLFVPDSNNQNEISILEGLTEEQRNQKASEILEKIESKLTTFKGEDGSDWVTISKGSQAKFMKYGLDYINKKLKPTDESIIERINEFTNVYNDRTRRAFTGSKWVLGCGIAVGVLFFLTGGISTFIFIHLFGLVFYFLSSRTTFYGIEKRMKYFGGGAGFIGGIMTALFLGNGVKYYVKEGSGPWKRDWETEGQMALMGLVILFIVAMILGIFAAFLGVINFFTNYSTSFLLPFRSEEKWYAENFA